jgi:hypothetical protein
VFIALTASAKHYASRQAIAEVVEALDLGSDCAVGDLVSFVRAGTQYDFAIIRRRWITNESGVRLELTLDHPAR